MTAYARLRDLAVIIRSKNAGPFELTLDIIFGSEDVFHRVRDSRVLTKQLVASLYSTTPDKVLSIVPFDPALAIKITLVRPCVSGAVGDSDVYGAQQHAPLLDVQIPISPDGLCGETHARGGQGVNRKRAT